MLLRPGGSPKKTNGKLKLERKTECGGKENVGWRKEGTLMSVSEDTLLDEGYGYI